MISMRIFGLETEKNQMILSELLEFCSRNTEFHQKLAKSAPDLDYILDEFLNNKGQILKNLLIFLENICNDEEIRFFLCNKEEIYVKMGILLLKSSNNAPENSIILAKIIGILSKFLISSIIEAKFIKIAFLAINLPLLNLLILEIPEEIKISSIKLYEKLIIDMPNGLFLINILINLLEFFPKMIEKELCDELFGIITKTLIKNPENSPILMKYPIILQSFCTISQEKYEISCIFILKNLYSDSKNIQILNNLSGKKLFLKTVKFSFGLSLYFY